MHRVEIKETNKEKIKRFVSGLRRDIQDQVELYEYSILENVFTLAFEIAIQLKRKRRAKKSYAPNHYFSHSWKENDKKKHDKFPSNSHQEPPSKSKSPSDGGVVRDHHMVFRAVDGIMPKTFKEISN